MPSTQTSALHQLRDSYHRVTDQIAEAALRSGRKPDNILMIAVTKTASPDQIRALVEMGHVDLGENRVQQLVQRVAVLDEFLSRRRTLAGAAKKSHAGDPDMPAHVRWHMIGHLQRNKIKQVVPHVRLIHSIDSLRLAEDMHAFAARLDLTVEVLVQVNVTGNPGRYGVAGPAVLHLAEQIDSMVHLKLRGLMCMASEVDDPEQARSDFARTADLFHEINNAKVAGSACNILSMGMSNDFTDAIEQGANMVRIGRALFGDDEA
jgi:pyridoxal phosphate enzyme (YggS family)